MPAQYEWMHEHFPFIPDSHLVFCGDKSIIAADFLIDDNAHHVLQKGDAFFARGRVLDDMSRSAVMPMRCFRSV